MRFSGVKLPAQGKFPLSMAVVFDSERVQAIALLFHIVTISAGSSFFYYILQIKPFITGFLLEITA